MLSVRKTFTFAAVVGLAFAIAAFAFAPAASAQAMGEYGATVGNATASAGAAPAIAPEMGGNFKVSTQSGGASGSSETVEVREDDSDEAAPPRARRHAKDSDRDDAGPDGDWVQVK